MLDYSLVHWLTFATAAIIVVATPGPDLACILGQTMRNGQKAGFASLFGMCTGAAFHISMVTLGLGSLISSSDLALSALKWAGAGYLIYLGVVTVTSAQKPVAGVVGNGTHGLTFSFRQGLFVNLLNPKAILFYIAFLPQFVVAGRGSEALQLAFHGGIVIVIAVLVYGPIVALTNRFSSRGKSQQRVGKTMDRLTGGVLMGLGAKIAISG